MLKNDSVLNDGLKTPEENYAAVQQAWTDEGMTTFKEYLVYYNNLDCGPFVEAVEKLQKYYFDRNIDMFKVSISLPGLARQMLLNVVDRPVPHLPFSMSPTKIYITL